MVPRGIKLSRYHILGNPQGYPEGQSCLFILSLLSDLMAEPIFEVHITNSDDSIR